MHSCTSVHMWNCSYSKTESRANAAFQRKSTISSDISLICTWPLSASCTKQHLFKFDLTSMQERTYRVNRLVRVRVKRLFNSTVQDCLQSWWISQPKYSETAINISMESRRIRWSLTLAWARISAHTRLRMIRVTYVGNRNAYGDQLRTWSLWNQLVRRIERQGQRATNMTGMDEYGSRPGWGISLEYSVRQSY